MAGSKITATSKTNNKRMATVASIWIRCTSGSLYTFPIYSSVLKFSQGYDQSTLDTVTVFKDFGANTGILSGVLYSSVAPSTAAVNGRGRPWVVLAAGAVQFFAGVPAHVAGGCGCASPAAGTAVHGMPFFNTANVVTAVRNFPNYSGTAVGIMKTKKSKSQVKSADNFWIDEKENFNLHIHDFFSDLFKSSGARNFSQALSPVSKVMTNDSATRHAVMYQKLRIFGTKDVDEKKHLDGFSAIALIVAAYLMAVIILDDSFTLPLSAHIFILAVLMILIASPICVAIKARHGDSLRFSRTALIEENQLSDDSDQLDPGTYVRRDPRGYDQVPDIADHETGISDTTVGWVENLNLLQAMRTSNFWFLFLAMACGMGTGLATLNNMSQIGGSLGYTNFETSTLVSLWSIWNFLGRFGAGYISDYSLNVKGWPRPSFVAITLAIMSVEPWVSIGTGYWMG
ncbi:hypothetical protein RJ639_023739 [Escallonia herrerae]|uniref:High affinity nitrate transporter n=1 Tax=Escallonia herrerae TaxID=1293975 RepID=A0AA88V0D6_9ASTE|nr:hypothetical protein RJ639_023739 [Escallonia herrerae]